MDDDQQHDQTVPVQTHPDTAAGDATAPRRRRRAAAGVAAAALLLTAGGLGYAGAQRFDGSSGASATASQQQGGTTYGNDWRRRQLPGTPLAPNATPYADPGAANTTTDTGTTATATQVTGLVRI